MNCVRLAVALVSATLAVAQSESPVFRADANLQSIAVQVTDKQGRIVRGLTAADFTLLEDGHPQKISFFGAENQLRSHAVPQLACRESPVTQPHSAFPAFVPRDSRLHQLFYKRRRRGLVHRKADRTFGCLEAL